MNKLSTRPNITIIGSGYVGVTAAAIFANIGYTVTVLEIDPERLKAIKNGQAFFFEEYIDGLLKHAIDSKRLMASSSYEEVIPTSDLIFSCVGTPDNPDGSSNLEYVYSAAREAAKYAKDSAVYVQKSTVPVGTGQDVIQIFEEANKPLAYVSNPEFLREGKAFIDSVWFDRVVVGGSSQYAKEMVLSIYRQLEASRMEIASLIDMPPVKYQVEWQSQYISVDLNSAELIKISANAFLALKISFANSIAKLADAAGADILKVVEGVGADQRIGNAFMRAGRGYGGGCFPKDVSGLISSGLEFGVNLSIMQAVEAENNSMPGYILEKLIRRYENETLVNKKVAVLGASFKAGTSDIRRSPAVKMTNLLIENQRAKVSVYDPEAFNSDYVREELNVHATIEHSLRDALKGAEIAIIATDWDEFTTLPSETFRSLMKGSIIVDAMNCLDREAIVQVGLTYIGVGRS